ncbi:metalloprotease family [Plasmopara halstedii]|uniref:Metalloprotease family n=1 Tax=Plasmopara halstedii TaxID=4781 RepID=A0A0P1B171_PLAHL|nr:metalloprotease family [Plasmopara halstedii]CEG48424.1 metalloprotease family [Plasmopara halstedii]|eukprot:XP_024584793.1 metalloprotease family [Plasmopara halstedii]
MLSILTFLHYHIKRERQQDDELLRTSDAIGDNNIGDEDCEINGVTLRHRSMEYYGEFSYVACSHGKASCFLFEPADDEASKVACPTQNFQQMIDKESAYRAHEKKTKQRVDRDDKVGLRHL